MRILILIETLRFPHRELGIRDERGLLVRSILYSSSFELILVCEGEEVNMTIFNVIRANFG